jgi:hypothetical protein
MDRRAFLTSAATLAGANVLTRAAGAAGVKTRLILLGTGGGPRPRKDSSAAAQVVIANGTPYVVDCGDGVARQLVMAGIQLDSLRHVFITHHHSDHNADYGNLIWLAWAAGLRTRVDAWGPPPLERMTQLFFEMNAYDIDTRIANEGRVALAPLVHVPRAEGRRPGDEGRERDGHGRPRGPSARGARVRVSHRRRRPLDRDLRRHRALRPRGRAGAGARMSSCTPRSTCPPSTAWSPAFRTPPVSRRASSPTRLQAEDAGRVAQAAGVKTLVLSHLVPPDDPEVTEQMWLDAARAHFRGQVIVGRDLLEIG